MAKSLVTGASGFIGSHLAESLVAAGDRVRALVRPTADANRLERLGVELCSGDLTDPASLERAVAGVERVFHCAALVADWDPQDLSARVNVAGSAALAEAALRAGVRKFVHLSTTEVYGHPDVRVSEDAPYRYRGWPYCDTKIEAEKRVWECHWRGLPATVLRPATVWGPRSKSVVVAFVKLLRSGQMRLIDRGRKTAGLCYIADLIDLMLRVGCPETGLGRVYNVADGAATTWAEFVNGLAALLGLPPVRSSIPRALAYPAGWLMEKWAALRGAGHRPLLTRMASEFMGTHQGFSSERAQRELGWQPRVFLAEGLRLVGDWLKEEGLISSRPVS
ncbi:MAG: NAD-dependent epimerase/dehydratase family protein [Candidatus Aminicenantes bacterium]|nr:NAD-dependent epimerase/dehydratase family protein [Candidatus Aminicenantes bacterium]